MGEDYDGLRGAYRYAFGASSSLVFRSYVVVSALVGLFVLVVVVLGSISWLARPTGLIGEQAFLWVLGLLVLIPLSVPVLVTARRRRLGSGSGRAELELAVSGYLFVLSWYVALVITDPNDHDVAGALGRVIEVLDSLPRLWGLAPPVIAAALIVLVVSRTGRSETSE